MSTIINADALNKVITAAFVDTAEVLADASKTQLQTEKWQWPRYTRRRNGKIAGLVRDRVDTGELLQSDRLVVYDANNAAIVNDAPHATYVALGTAKMPGTNWMQGAIDATNVEQVFADKLERKL